MSNTNNNSGVTPIGKIKPKKVPAYQAKAGSDEAASKIEESKNNALAQQNSIVEMKQEDILPTTNEAKAVQPVADKSGLSSVGLDASQAQKSFADQANKTSPQQAQSQPAQQITKENQAKKDEAAHLFSGKRDQISDEDKAFLGDIDAVWNDTGSKKQRVVTLLILGLLLSFIAWASWATVDELTRGQGQVIASSRTQVITHLEGGILMDILVTEGVIVEEGQVLARVENVAAESVIRDTQQKIYNLDASIIRLRAELRNEALVYSQELIDAAPDVVALQTQVYNTRRLQFESELSVLAAQSQQAQFELDDLEKRLLTVEQTHQLTSQRLNLARPMVDRGLYAEVDFLNLQQEIVSLEGEMSTLQSNISKATTAIEETELKQRVFKSEYDTKLIAEINELTSEVNSLKETLTTGQDRVVRTEIRSPMRGVVNRIVLNTRGSAVRPGEPIMEVVPLDDTLLIEAKIRPADIGFIYPNQYAMVKLTAYDFSIFGGLEAYVEQISADTTEGPNQEYFYLVKLRTKENRLEYRGETLPIIPGMIASVDIVTGKKTIMQYLLKPILKAKDNALRER